MRAIPASDCSLMVYCDGASVAPLAHALETNPLAGVLNIHPAYASVLIVFDPRLVTHHTVERFVLARLAATQQSWQGPTRVIDIPVRYDGEDLRYVAEFHGLSQRAVIEVHSSATYTAAFLGFAPGFAYLTGLPAALETPRLDAPRPRVRAGSVAIAGSQAAVYPLSTPGGWRILGHTVLTLFDSRRTPMNLIAIGDRVRFVPEANL